MSNVLKRIDQTKQDLREALVLRLTCWNFLREIIVEIPKKMIKMLKNDGRIKQKEYLLVFKSAG